MNCTQWEERVALFAGGDLAAAEAAEVERHLAECADCSEFHEGLCATLDTLHEEHHTEIASVHFTAVRTAVISEIQRERKVWRRLAWASGVGIAAALLLGISLRPGPLPAPPPRIAAVIPAASLERTLERPAALSPIAPPVTRKTRPHHEPVLVKLQTADPKIVIYWIAD
jgi:hypothetical protein